MDLSTISAYFSEYGAIAIFIIVFLEYLNLPGFPAGIIMPLAGIFAAQGKIAFPLVLFLSVCAGLLGSLFLYAIGYWGGEVFLRAFTKKFPGQKPAIDKAMNWLAEKGVIGVFIAKLMPVIRTIISIPAGVTKMNLVKYCISSTAGICLWNLAFIGAGYLCGDAVFEILGNL